MVGDDRHFGGATVSDSPFGRASPILVLGVIIFIAPMVGTAVGMNIPFKFVFSVIGVLCIIAGVIHSIVK